MAGNSPEQGGLTRAYRATYYEVHGVQRFILHVDEYSEALMRLYRQRRCSCAAFLTAWNPHSQLSNEGENRRTQKQLETVLVEKGYPYLPGRGVDPGGDWPGEDSVLVPGLPLAAADDLARQFNQNAFLWAGADAVPRLMLTGK